MPIKIHSKNAAYQKFEVLISNRNKRHRYGEFIVEGVRNINEAVKQGWEINAFIYDGERRLSDWATAMLKISTGENYALSPVLMNELSGRDEPSELIAIVKMKNSDTAPLMKSDSPLIVLFDRPSNKGNLGTVIRSCDALGATGLITTGHCVDIYEPDVIVSSMGSFFALPFVHLPSAAEIQLFISQMREKHTGFAVYGTTAHSAKNISEATMSGPALLMIGNETDGLSRGLKEMCDELLTIPMASTSSASSLNVGCAATVLLYEASRQRRL